MSEHQQLYDFHLSAEQEQRAYELHERSIVIDLLFQGPLSPGVIPPHISDQLKQESEPLKDDPLAYSAFPAKKLRQMSVSGELEPFKEEWYRSGITAGNRELDLSTPEAMITSMGEIQEQFDRFDWLIKALSASDIRSAKAHGLKAGIVTAQDPAGIGTNLELLEALHRYGLRVLQLTYNNQNAIASGCMELANGGVSNFGMTFIRKLNELGIVVDTSHCGKQTTLDACRLSDKPVIASHTGAEAIYPHRRCKSDEELRAIAATGGVIGVFAMPWFVHGDPQATTIDHVLDHIDYIVSLVGTDHVAIGTDWPMSDVSWSLVYFKEHIAPKLGFAKGDGPSTELIHGFEQYGLFVNFTRGLVARGYSDEQVSNIIGGNWLRVFEQVWGR
ncbi:dipeptidase [Paenibacillus protaetiae]|uniref:Dipeptidase n=1 Tax=Paenibacillus protaetiae TaxID=2509456 RepID=A0A4P6EYX7_9BACL|nr:membrane dipeptidase [Paenibacillus protaetiae]QAY65897.1 hypothetical protein ET464_05370 [Paenibacillus protaetiae]